jgi:hypothetical protein
MEELAGHWWLTPVMLNYSGGRDPGRSWLEASPSKQFHKTLSQKTLHKNRAGGVAQGEGHKFKPQYRKKKKDGGTGHTNGSGRL